MKSRRGVAASWHASRPWRWRSARPRRKRVVFTNGVFDLLHPGHVRYLRSAQALATPSSSASTPMRRCAATRARRGRSHPEPERAEVIAALASVDAAVVFDEDTPPRSSGASSPTSSSRAPTGPPTRSSAATPSKPAAAASCSCPSNRATPRRRLSSGCAERGAYGLSLQPSAVSCQLNHRDRSCGSDLEAFS